MFCIDYNSLLIALRRGTSSEHGRMSISFLLKTIANLFHRNRNRNLQTSKAPLESKAPAYSRALRLVRGVVQKSSPRGSESGFQRIREGTADVKAGVF